MGVVLYPCKLEVKFICDYLFIINLLSLLCNMGEHVHPFFMCSISMFLPKDFVD